MKQSISNLSKIEGWFPWIDRETFIWLLHDQTQNGTSGDLLEVGCYMGKSAIVIGDGLIKKEKFTVVDLFEDTAPDQENAKEVKSSYPTLTRKKFENNYLSFHPELPTIIPHASSIALRKIKPKSCRFIHIDGSHLYDHVIGDVEKSKELALDDAIIVYDDYRSAHTPGVSAAVWEAVASGFKPICITPAKLYGTWGNPSSTQERLVNWINSVEEITYTIEKVASNKIIRMQYTNNPAVKQNEEIKHLKNLLADKRLEIEAIHNSKTFRISYQLGRPIRYIRKALSQS